MLTVLRQRNVALLGLAGLISILGDWLLLLALPYYVYAVSGSALATGAALAAGTLPRIVVGPLAGVLVDRWDRRRTMIVSDLLRAVLLLPLLLAASPESLWLVYVVQFLGQAIGQFFQPAKGALVPHLVAPRDLVAANALDELTAGAGRLVGPPLGGVLLLSLGFPAVVLLDAASFLVSALLLALIAVPASDPFPGESRPAPAPPDASPPAATSLRALAAAVWCEWVAGLRLLRGRRALVHLFALNAAVMLAYGLVFVLLVVFVRDVLAGGPLELAWLATVQGVGTILGGIAAGQLGGTVAPGRLFGAGAVAVGAGLLVALLVAVRTPAIAPVLAGFLLVGVGVAGTWLGARTLLQTGVTDAYRGRALATFGTASAVLMLVGQGLAGVLVPSLGVVATLGLAGALYLGAGLGALVLLPR